MRVFIALVIGGFWLQGCATDTAIEDIEAEFVMPKEVTAVVDEARQAADKGNLPAVREKYAQLVKEQPKNLAYRVEFASVLFRLGVIEDAERAYMTAAEVGYCELGRESASSEVHPEPEHSFANGKAQRQRYCSIILNSLGVIADMDADYASAEGYYQASLKAYDEDVSVYNNYGYSLLMAHRYPEAEAIFSHGVRVDPYAERVRHNWALAKAWQRNYKAALKTYSAQKKTPQGYNNIGYIALLNKDYDIAIELFEEAIRLSPSYYAKAGRNLEKAQELAAADKAGA